MITCIDSTTITLETSRRVVAVTPQGVVEEVLDTTAFKVGANSPRKGPVASELPRVQAVQTGAGEQGVRTVG